MLSVVHVILLVLSAGVATAQEFPSRPIRIFTSTAGGNSDFVARNIAQGISGPLGQSVLVENRPSIQLVSIVLKEKPDGHTLLLGGGGMYVRPLMTKLPYDVFKDFSPISVVSREVNLVIVHPSVPVKSIKELIALAKARPGELNSGRAESAVEIISRSSYSSPWPVLTSSTFDTKGGAPAILGLASGEVQMAIYDLGLVQPQMKVGRVRALAVTTADPSALVPDLPTVSASGLPGYESVSITAMWAPAKTPGGIIQRLNQEIVRTLRTAETKQRFLGNASEVVASSAEELGAAVKAEISRLEKVIKAANITLE